MHIQLLQDKEAQRKKDTDADSSSSESYCSEEDNGEIYMHVDLVKLIRIYRCRIYKSECNSNTKHNSRSEGNIEDHFNY